MDGNAPPRAARNRAVSYAARVVQSKVPKLDCDGSGTIWIKAAEAARCNLDAGAWQPSQGWWAPAAEKEVGIDNLNQETRRVTASPP